MKKVSFLTMLLIAIVTVSFARSNGNQKPLPYAKNISPTATGFTVSQVIPINIFVITCDGELLELQGNLHELYHITINNNRIVVKYLDNPQGITGTSSTGVKYQGTGGTQGTLSGSLVNKQYSESYINNFRIIGQGPYNNFVVHENFHITINTNGEITAYVDNFSVECQ